MTCFVTSPRPCSPARWQKSKYGTGSRSRNRTAPTWGTRRSRTRSQRGHRDRGRAARTHVPHRHRAWSNLRGRASLEPARTSPRRRPLQASWLVYRGVPLGQILLFLSPLDHLARLRRRRLSVSPARREPIGEKMSRVVCDWRSVVPWLYSSGHRIVGREDRLRFFYAHAPQASPQAEPGLVLAADRPPESRDPGLPRQIAIVDACQTSTQKVPREEDAVR